MGCNCRQTFPKTLHIQLFFAKNQLQFELAFEQKTTAKPFKTLRPFLSHTARWDLPIFENGQNGIFSTNHRITLSQKKLTMTIRKT